MSSLIFSIVVLLSTSAWALPTPAPDKIVPCAAGIRHPDNEAKIKDGKDRVVLVTDQGKYKIESPYGEKTYVTADINPWAMQLTDIKFQFATESYGAQYYIEFCYFGPKESSQVDSSGTKLDLSQDIYSLLATVDIRNLIEGSVPYAQKARLFSKYEVTCDLRGMGRSTAPRAENEIPNGPIESDISWGSNQLSPIFNGYFNIESPLNQTPQATPRFCSVRIYFSEGVNTLRSNKDVHQSFETFLDVKRSGMNGLN